MRMLSLDATVHILWLGTPVAACISGVTVLTALSIDSWLKSEEKILNPSYRNGSSKVEFLSKWTTSGLFTLCATDLGRSEFHCQRINYFPTEEYSPDPNDSTMAIPYTVLKSVGFFLTAVVLLTAAEVLCLSGHCCSRRRFFTFLSGITFIISGLFMMLGMVIYIATLKGEVADKLRPRSTFQPPLFTYTYGWSCYLIMMGFIATEMSGISAIFLYIYWHKRDWSKKDEERYNSQLLETPPPCLKHPRPRSLSFHSSLEQESQETPALRRSRSQQFLDGQAQNQPVITLPMNHITQNHVSHHNLNHVDHYSQHHTRPPQRQESFHNSSSRGYRPFNEDGQHLTCGLEDFHQPQIQNNGHHQQTSLHHQKHTPQQHQPQTHQDEHLPQHHQQSYQYHQQHDYPHSGSQHNVQWNANSFDSAPKSGRSLIDLNKQDYRDEVFFSRSGTLPRSYPRENPNNIRGGSTLPRSFPRSSDPVYDPHSSYERWNLHKNYAKDDTALCSSFQRRGFSYPGCVNLPYNPQSVNTLYSSQTVPCNMGPGCCSCCAYYCCCCYWQDGGNARPTVPNYGYRSATQRQGHPYEGLNRRCSQWQRKYYPGRTPVIPRDHTCNTVSSSVDLNGSSGSVHHHHQYPQQHHHQQQPNRQGMVNLCYQPRTEVPRSSYQSESQRHTTPV